MPFNSTDRQRPPPVRGFDARRQIVLAYVLVIGMPAVGRASVCWMQYQIEMLAEHATAEGQQRLANVLKDALSRLAIFRASCDHAGVIDQASGLTTADLDVIISLAPALKIDVEGMRLNDN